MQYLDIDPEKLLIVYLKLKFNWLSCVLICKIWQFCHRGHYSAKPQMGFHRILNVTKAKIVLLETLSALLF